MTKYTMTKEEWMRCYKAIEKAAVNLHAEKDCVYNQIMTDLTSLERDVSQRVVLAFKEVTHMIEKSPEMPTTEITKKIRYHKYQSKDADLFQAFCSISSRNGFEDPTCFQ